MVKYFFMAIGIYLAFQILKVLIKWLKQLIIIIRRIAPFVLIALIFSFFLIYTLGTTRIIDADKTNDNLKTTVVKAWKGM